MVCSFRASTDILYIIDLVLYGCLEVGAFYGEFPNLALSGNIFKGTLTR